MILPVKAAIFLRRYLKYIPILMIVVLLEIFIWKLDLLHWQKLDLDKIHAQPKSTIVYDADGKETASFASKERKYL